MNPIQIIQKYYKPVSSVYNVLLKHSEMVKDKALEIADTLKLNIDYVFIQEAVMLHDIGIFLTYAPGINCHGSEPYIRHGFLGANILRAEGYPRHALVCERHVGVGISKDDIINQKLPLPERGMLPLSWEEKIICVADLFFSKDPSDKNEKDIDQIKKYYHDKHGEAHLQRLEKLLRELNISE